MTLEEMTSVCYAFGQDWARKATSGYLRLLINTGAIEFVKITGVLTARAVIPVASGVADLSPIPDSVNLAGRILRVEDVNNANRSIDQTNETVLDVIVGKHWRSVIDGQLKHWLRGIPPESATQDGHGRLLTYPAVTSGSINVFYVKMPRKLRDDTDESDIPEEHHMAMVWYAVVMLLTAGGDPAMAGQLAFAQAQWAAEVERGKAGVSLFATQMG